jgi:hypothetical protein
MTEPTPGDRAAMDQMFAALGVPMHDRYDRAVLLAANREGRRRNKRTDPGAHAAMEQIADGIYVQMRSDVPIADWASAVDALLAVSGYLASFAASGVDPTALNGVIAYLADDIATEEGL